MNVQNIGDILTLTSVHPTANRTATGQSSAADLRDYAGDVALILDSTATDAGGETMDVKVQDSDDGSTGWADVSGATFAQVTNAAASQQKIVINKDAVKRYIRAVYTIAGGTPTFTFSVNALGVKKYPA